VHKNKNQRLLVTGILLLGLLSPAALVSKEEAESQTRYRPYLLMDVMHQFQRYVDKLYFAGKAQNWRLAEWYLWKIEQSALPLIEGEVEPYRNEKYDTQPLAKAMLIPSLRAVEPSIEAKNLSQFLTAYSGLVQTCNACHVATNHGYVKIIVPTAPIYSNQDYAP
jgi:hypothetical protein